MKAPTTPLHRSEQRRKRQAEALKANLKRRKQASAAQLDENGPENADEPPKE